jgi:two-component system sensor histidine kinase QseC
MVAKGEFECARIMERARALPGSFSALVVLDASELDRMLNRLAAALGIIGTSMLGLTIAFVLRISSRGLAPLEAVAQRASHIDEHTLDQRFPNDIPIELRSICERLNDLLSRLQSAFARERRFSADVAHELRTPIAELRAIAEVALKWPTPDPEVVGAFQDVVAAAGQMQGIVDGLLAIARCEGGREPVAVESMRVSSFPWGFWPAP